MLTNRHHHDLASDRQQSLLAWADALKHAKQAQRTRAAAARRPRPEPSP